MALYRGKLIADTGAAIQILTWGKVLSGYTEQAVDELGIKGIVSTFVKWWGEFCRSNWREVPQLEPYVFDWEAIADIYMRKGLPKSEIPFLLIDEGQDLPPTFFRFAKHVAAELTVFADQNQRIMDNNSTLPEIRNAIKPDGEFRLRRNYRNTRPIAEVATHFVNEAETGIPDLPERSGPKPVLRAFEKRTQATRHIANMAKTNRHLQIGVLVPTKKRVKSYAKAIASSGMDVQCYFSASKNEERPPPIDFGRPGVVITTWKSAKGLEFDIVFIAELQDNWLDLDDPTLKMQLYVLASRAREQLHITYTGKGTPPILSLLPLEKMEFVA
jgi:superfamily I DNA/RNA helicase